MKDAYMGHDEWALVERGLDKKKMRLAESLTAVGNGYMGMRGNFEEDYSGDSLRGTYIGGVWFPDKTRVGWWKNGYPLYFGKVINAVNMIGIRVSVDDVNLDLNKCEVKSFERRLDMHDGVLSREFTVALPKGEVKVSCERLLSIARQEILAIKYGVTPSWDARVTFEPYLDANVKNEDSNYDETFWEMIAQSDAEGRQFLVTKTKPNPFDTPTFTVCAAMKSFVGEAELPVNEVRPGYISARGTYSVKAGQSVTLNKYVALTTSRDYAEDELPDEALTRLNTALFAGYDNLLAEQFESWSSRWSAADVLIEGDPDAQQGIRFNIFQLFCTYDGSDARLNIGPKGFTGEKYGGATYWDTEAYCLPMYLSIAPPDVARNLLLYRYNQLDGAYHNAREQGLEGALYPMVTFNGIECHNEWEITFEELHRNAAIAHAIYQYVAYTGDTGYLATNGIDVLMGIARFWASRVHYCQPKNCYMIHGVTGPNEYENNVNNNWYTNRMAKWCLEYTCEVARSEGKSRWADLNITEPELAHMTEIAEGMYLPYSEELGVFVAHDTFLDKDLMPASAIPADQRPINQHWSWDHILRSCFIKQADTLQGMYALGHLYDLETKRRNFEFYEPMTVHESSLSPCVHSILASELGMTEKAVEMYHRTARLDLDNINNDTVDGCHITSMAGSYLAIARGFAGMRVNDGLSFKPFLPECWQGYGFKIRYRDRVIALAVKPGTATLTLVSGEPVEVTLADKRAILETELTVKLA